MKAGEVLVTRHQHLRLVGMTVTVERVDGDTITVRNPFPGPSLVLQRGQYC